MTEDVRDLAPRPVELDGATLGVLDTGSDESAHYLDLLTAKLEKRHFLSAVVRVAKPAERQDCPPTLLQDLARRCDVVVIGVARTVEAVDCAARDAAALEQASVASAVLVEDGLGLSLQAVLGTYGYGLYESVIELTHPAQEVTDVHDRVEASFRDVERALTAGDLAAPATPAPRNGEVSCEC